METEKLKEVISKEDAAIIQLSDAIVSPYYSGTVKQIKEGQICFAPLAIRKANSGLIKWLLRLRYAGKLNSRKNRAWSVATM